MRNLAQYPVTVDEVGRTLRSVSEDIARQGAIGDTRGLVLTYLAEYVETNKEAVTAFLATKDIRRW